MPVHRSCCKFQAAGTGSSICRDLFNYKVSAEVLVRLRATTISAFAGVSVVSVIVVLITQLISDMAMSTSTRASASHRRGTFGPLRWASITRPDTVHPV